MKILVTIFVSLCFIQNLFADDLFYINFNEKSEFVKSIFNRIDYKEDELILLLINPNSAPRLEVNINNSLNAIYKVVPSSKVITLVGYPRLNSALNYIDKSNFNSKVLVDTSMILFDELKVRQAPPIFTKWSSKGELLNYQVLYGISPDDTNLWRDFYTNNRKKVIEKSVSERIIKNSGYDLNDFNKFKKPTLEKAIDLNESKDNSIGVLYGLTVDPNDKYLITTDNLTLKTLVFDLERGELSQELFLDYNQRKMFSKELPDVYFKEVEQRKTAGTLFFKPFFSKDKLIVTATLPRVELNVVNGDSSLSLYNVGCLVKYKNKQKEFILDEVQEIEFNLNSKVIPTHTNIGELNKTSLPLPVIKGYPAVGFTKANRPKDEIPIFNEFFLDAPLFQMVDITNGRIEKNIGELSRINQVYGSGYYFNNPQITFYRNQYVVSQHLVPFLEFENKEKLMLKSYFDKQVIEIQRNKLDSAPSTEAMDIINIKSKAAIVQIKTVKDDIFVLWKLREKGKVVRNSSIYILQKYSINNKQLEYEKLVPFKYENLSLVDYKIDNRLNKLICLYQSPTKIKLLYYNIN
jgi:hypothetical protein